MYINIYTYICILHTYLYTHTHTHTHILHNTHTHLTEDQPGAQKKVLGTEHELERHQGSVPRADAIAIQAHHPTRLSQCA